MVEHVHPAARIGVLQPGSAHIVVLVEHHAVDAGLLEAVRGQDPRHARPDDGHRVIDGAVRRPGTVGEWLWHPQVSADRELLGQHRAVAVVQVGAGQPADEGRHERIVGAARASGGRGCQVAEAGDGQLAGPGQLIVVPSPVGFQGSARVQPQLIGREARIAGGVGQRGQQAGQVGRTDEPLDVLGVHAGSCRR